MALEDATNPVRGVSGPGKFAKRTDLQYKPQAYGEGVQMQQAQSGAPLATSSDVRPEAPSTFRRQIERGSNAAQAQGATPGLYDPTQRPNEPVTHGIDMGAGAGSEALMMRQPDDSAFRMNIQAAKPVLAYIADLPNTSPETRAALKELWDMQ